MIDNFEIDNRDLTTTELHIDPHYNNGHPLTVEVNPIDLFLNSIENNNPEFFNTFEKLVKLLIDDKQTPVFWVCQYENDGVHEYYHPVNPPIKLKNGDLTGYSSLNDCFDFIKQRYKINGCDLTLEQVTRGHDFDTLLKVINTDLFITCYGV